MGVFLDVQRRPSGQESILFANCAKYVIASNLFATYARKATCGADYAFKDVQQRFDSIEVLMIRMDGQAAALIADK